MADRKLAELCKEAVETTVESEFLVPVEVRNQNGGEEIGTILCGLDATTQDVKEFLRKRVIKNENQTELRLSDVNGNALFWHLPTARPPHTTKLTFHVAPLDTRLDALFHMVGMGDESERDRMMEKMMVPRLPRNCPGNHSLPDAQASNRGRANNHNVLMCAKCRWYAFRGQGCKLCQFALCANCFREDRGLTVEDPRSEIVVIATRIGTKFAGCFCSIGLGLYSTSIRWSSDLGEIVPRFWSDDRNGHEVRIDDRAQVLHNGVRLVVRLSQKVRRLLDASSDRHNKATNPNLYPGETIAILSDGASLLDLKTYCKAISESEAWPVVTDELKRRVLSSGQFAEFEDEPNFYEITIKLVSFLPEQVVYEVGARINSNALAAKRSFPGECGYNFGRRSSFLADQLWQAGATLD